VRRSKGWRRRSAKKRVGRPGKRSMTEVLPVPPPKHDLWVDVGYIRERTGSQDHLVVY
jgi:hypothetical protein